MQQTIGAYRQSVAQGFLAAAISYNRWYELGTGLLIALQDTADPTPLILGAYWLGDVALSKIIIPLHLYPDTPRSHLPAGTIYQLIQWVEVIQGSLQPNLRTHLQWPNEIMARLEALLMGIDTSPSPGFSKEQKTEIVKNIGTR